MENPAKQAKSGLNPSFKLALAMTILQSRRRQKSSSSSSATADPASGINAAESDPIKWKRKVYIPFIHLSSINGMQHDLFPQNVSCKCYFFDNLGELSPKLSIDGSESDHKRFNDVLRRRFLRQDHIGENELEKLRSSVDFLVELCETSSPVRVEEGDFKNWSHQAVDFILVILLVAIFFSELHQSHKNFEFYVQHLMRKLGSDPYIGQRTILAVSHRISVVAESLLFMDPFDGAFPKVHNCIYKMIQLIEFLISDYILSWSTSQDFDIKLLEEWVASVFHARKALELLESRNALYMMYMDRVVGDLTRRIGQVSFLQELRPDTLTKLFG
ncbi:hypothetical protein RD792_012566 [Penstemon davidsonii]|uniref:Protein MULTIPOLAR SPINDLE 1 n=1 Tax=Penstemon davidsonii TaxID=160366 RepID=A0ABR0CX81_9LAMI|nr:hypothetical protein RD792_012566 [Penstemon davidsonii]